MLEVAEAAVLSESVHRRENLRVLGDAGIGLVIDDFGSAQSLAHLSGVRFGAIKLDRRFIAGDPSTTRDATVAAAASIGNAAGVRVIAEGVDTTVQRERVERLGCGFGQGWQFGRPVAAHEFDALLDVGGRARGFVEQPERHRACDRVLARVDPELAVLVEQPERDRARDRVLARVDPELAVDRADM
jgi:EAL domain-containing protein (putative c-di-GMP-specific phosphodiesterase class I)